LARQASIIPRRRSRARQPVNPAQRFSKIGNTRFGIAAIAQESSRPPTIKAMPPPISGWNKRDSLELMKDDEAVTMDNWFPGISKVVLRRGHTEFADTQTTSAVDTLAEYHDGATQRMIAGAGGKLWNCTAGGSAVALGSGYSSNRWQVRMFNGAMGLVNGTDGPLTYDGSSVSVMTVSASGISGGVGSFIGLHVHESRTYYWQDNTQDFWYSATNAIGGSLAKFPLSRVGQFGGKLIAMATWNVEGGTTNWGGGGAGFDLAVFFMSSGEVIIYQGDDPVNTWNLIGVHKIGAVIDIRGIARIGGDLAVITEEGYTSMAQIIGQGRQDRAGMISDKIRDQVLSDIANYGANTGWEIVTYPKGNWIQFNVPISATQMEQHVQNTTTKAWARFQSINGRTFALYNNDLYFGHSNGKIYKSDTGNTDDGSAIDGFLATAYSYLGDRQSIKDLGAAHLVLGGQETLSIGIAPQLNFQETTPALGSVVFGPTKDQWQAITTQWENMTDAWIASQTTRFDGWFAMNGADYAVGLGLRVQSSKPTELHSYSYSYQRGGGFI